MDSPTPAMDSPNFDLTAGAPPAAVRHLHLTPRMVGHMVPEERNPNGHRPHSTPCDRKRAQYGQVL
eukprot:5033092-Pyramimonas_sp.AAC.1